MRVAPREELVNILEFEEEAKKKLQPVTFALIAGGDRALLDRITLRPRMNIPTTDMADDIVSARSTIRSMASSPTSGMKPDFQYR